MNLERLMPFHKDLYHCADCNYCVDSVWVERGITEVCATINHHSPALGYSGRGFVLAARALVEGVALNPDSLAERVFSCTGCGNCEAVCPIGLRPAQIGQALRETLAAEEVLPTAIRTLRQRMREDGNAYGASRDSRARWAEGLAYAPVEAASVHYTPGCAVAYTRPAEARASVALLMAAGEAVHFAGANDACCGAPLREAGLRADAEFAEQALAARVQAPLLVTSGLECLPGSRGAAARVMGFPAWLLEAVTTGRLLMKSKPGAPLQVEVFDSCAARRAEGEPDALRAVLAALGVTVCNPGEARHVVCCGASGNLPAMHATSAARMASARTPGQHDFPVVGADPRCLSHLADGGRAERYFGLAEFLLAHFDTEGVA